MSDAESAIWVAVAQVHATLALAHRQAAGLEFLTALQREEEIDEADSNEAICNECLKLSHYVVVDG